MKRFKIVYSLLTLILSLGLIVYINSGKVKLGLNIFNMQNNKVVKKSENIESKDFIFNLGEDGDKIKYTNRPIDPGELSIESILENNKKLGEKRTLVDISAKYNYKFNDFKLKLENEISKLIETGITEYNSGNFSETRLADKYLSEGAKLEQKFDKEFNLLVNELRKELEENYYDTSIIKDFKDYYEIFKAEKKGAVVAKGMELSKEN